MLFIAAIAGLAAVVMAARWMQGQSGNQGRIAIANADIELGGRISREMVRMADWPQGSVPAGAFEDPAALEGRVVLNGKLQNEPFAEPCGGGEGCDFPTEITIPPGHYFMMGDNRGSSDDSRFWGPVPKKWIIGQAFATYWPPKRIGLL